MKDIQCVICGNRVTKENLGAISPNGTYCQKCWDKCIKPWEDENRK